MNIYSGSVYMFVAKVVGYDRVVSSNMLHTDRLFVRSTISSLGHPKRMFPLKSQIRFVYDHYIISLYMV